MSVAQLDRVSDSDSEGHGFESRRAYHVAASLYGLLHFLYRKYGFACQAAAPLSQKVLRLFGRPVPAAHFYFSAFMACRIFFTENTAALVRLPLLFPKKSCDFLGALRLRRVFILAPLGLPLHRDGLRDLPIFVCTKISHRCVVPPLSQKVLRLFGSPAHGLYKSHCALILMRLLFRKKSRSACLFACECAHDDKPSTKFCERAAGAIRENVTYQKGNCDGSYL